MNYDAVQKNILALIIGYSFGDLVGLGISAVILLTLCVVSK